MVDVVINVFGKVHQTALSILSLVEHCHSHINTIYFQKEKYTATYEHLNHDHILEYYSSLIKSYIPKYWNGIDPNDIQRLKDDRDYLLSIRYQYGWESCASKYLLTIHNDIDVRDDVIGNLLARIGENTGIGEIGQCWWCPAYQNSLCTSDTYTSFKPSYQYLMHLYNKDMDYTQRRAYNFGLSDQFKESPWPLPECRLNEWCALINMDKARKDTAPTGKAVPFGSRVSSGSLIGDNWDRPVCLDVGVQWFRELLHMNHSFAHYDVNKDIVHDKRGSVKLDSREEYVKAEIVALNEIKIRYPDFYEFMNSRLNKI